ncbi:hypothetical protein MMC17_009334 [Xylographa soralifera]|nr:hypothetical protein [Xylographa soralifera]
MAPPGHRCNGLSSIIGLLLQLLILSIIGAVEAQSASGTPLPAPTSAGPSATVVPSTALYTYAGCYNETTGDDAAGNVRALAGGNMTATSSMTVSYCLSYCGGSAFAGIEYGRECWCAPYINANSQKLPDSDCTDACEGDGTEICGGALRLTVYQHKNATTSGATVLSLQRAGYGATRRRNPLKILHHDLSTLKTIISAPRFRTSSPPIPSTDFLTVHADWSSTPSDKSNDSAQPHRPRPTNTYLTFRHLNVNPPTTLPPQHPTTMSPPPPTLLLLPGAWHSPTCYTALTHALCALPTPIPSLALALPSTSTPAPRSPFAADVAAIRAAVSRLVRDEHKAVVVVMHSYSGAPGTSALAGLTRAARARDGQPGGVVALVYLVAYMLPEGASILPAGERGRLEGEGEGEGEECLQCRTTTISASVATDVFYGDLPPAEAARWVAQLLPQAMDVFHSPLTYAAWRDVPSMVVVCEADRAMPPAKVEEMVGQARALGAAEIVVERMGGGHFPMLGRVEECVGVLRRVVERVRGT